MVLFNLKIFFRQLQRFQRFSISSFVGLVVGITAFLVVLLFANALEKYNNWNPEFDGLYELRYNKQFKAISYDGVMKLQTPLLAKCLRSMKEVLSFCRIKEQSGTFIQSAHTSDFEDKIMGVDSNFFQLFPLKLAYGNANTVLDSVRNVVVSKHIANKYFGRENCVGDSLYLANVVVKIVGVLADNGPTTFPTDIIGRLTIPKWAQEKGWGNFGYKYYCKLAPNYIHDIEQRQQLALDISKVWYQIPQVFQSQKDFVGLGATYDAWLKDPNKIKMQFFEVRKLYMEDKKTLFIVLITIGVTVLVLCCLDYMNKQISFSDTRNIEIGVKRLNGWTSKMLLSQVFVETIAFVSVAFFASFVVIELLLPFVNKLLNEDIQLYSSLMDFSFLWKLLAFFSIVVIIAGAYPAFYIASLEPVTILKGSFHGNDKGHKFRLSLLGIQTALGISILIVVATVWLQIRFLGKMDLGFDHKDLYYFKMSSDSLSVERNRDKLDSMILRYPSVVSHAYTSQMPLVGSDNNFEPIKTEHGTVNSLMVSNGGDFFSMIGTNKIFQGQLSKKEKDVVVNQTFVDMMHWKDSVIGKTIITDISPNMGFGWADTFIVRGVTKNILYENWEYKTYPIIYTYTSAHNGNFLLFRMKPNTDKAFVRNLEMKILNLFPGNPVQIKSSEADYENSFQQVDFLFKVLSFFSVLIIVGVILGFVTYANFYFQRVRKEMILRVLMGAKPLDFLLFFAKDVAFSLSISLVGSWLLCGFVLKIFFSHFAYLVQYPYWLYLIIPLFFILMAIFILWQTLKQLLKKEPAEILKYE